MYIWEKAFHYGSEFMKKLALFLFAAAAAFSQPVGGGLKVGIPFTDFVDKASSGNINNFKNPKRFIIGLTGEVRLPFHLAIEADVLYRKMKYSGSVTGTSAVDVTTEGNTWEFPLLVKYRFRNELVRPFVDGGFAWNRLSGLTQTVKTIATGGSVSQASNTTLRGLVLGAGLDVKALFLHIQPEIRFTRWGAKKYFDPGDFFGRNQNQAEFLLGISF